MANTKCILGLIAGVATGAIAIILTTSTSSAAATPVKSISQPDALTDALKDSFSGWLDRLKKGELDHPEQGNDNPAKAGEDKIRSIMHHAKGTQSS